MKCFVIRPFSDTIHKEAGVEIKTSSKEWSYIYDNWIKKAVDNYKKTIIECACSKLVPGNFIKDIIKDLKESEIVIADLTGQRPNVFYELGIRHSLCLGTIIISQDKSEVPSDLNSYYCFEYKYTKIAHEYDDMYEKFENNLHSKIDNILENPARSDNPVSDFLDIKHYYSKKVFEKDKIDFNSTFGFFKYLVISVA
jgi:hypothetical protein